jgi:hypothetical protein
MLVALQCVPGLDTFVCIPTVPQNYGTAVVRWVKSSARPPPLAVWFVQFEADEARAVFVVDENNGGAVSYRLAAGSIQGLLSTTPFISTPGTFVDSAARV